jgi:beta-lactamase regulating signal transducer with metallopeptidase domain
MNLFESLFSPSATQMLGWGLLHSLWQVTILAIFLKIILSGLRKNSANTRYLISCITLLLMLILPVSTALWSYSGSQNVDLAETNFSISKSKVKVILPPEIFAETNISPSEPFYQLWFEQLEKQVLPWLVLIWSFGVFISSLRLLVAWTFTLRLKRDKRQLVLKRWQEILERLLHQLQVSKPVIILESSLIQVPTVVGWLKPVILIPSCALTGLTPQQLELIIVHELAHIRQNDYLVNLFQTIVEALLFYHPAVWMVSAEIRKERENVCDDLAVSVGGGAVIYACALTKLERLRKTAPSFAMAADGGGMLTYRIHRLLGIENSAAKHFVGGWVMLLITILIIAAGVTKQNSTGIAEYISDELSLNIPYILPSFTNSELNKDAIENSSPENAVEKQRNKKSSEESTKGLLLLPQSEKSFDVKFDTKQNFGIEDNANQKAAETAQGQGIESLKESSQVIEQVNEVIVPKINEAVNTFTNTKYQEENKPDSQSESQDFIEEMASVGYQNLSIEELIKLKKAGVTANYVKSLRALGFNNLTVKDLASMSDEDVTSAYIVGIRRAGYQELTGKELAYFKDLGITPEFINKFRAAGYDNLSVKDLLRFRDYRITADFINNMNAVGLGKLSPNELISLHDSKITPEFVSMARNRLGSDLTLKQIIEFKRNGTLKDNE